ncbi:hypothetical protein [Polycladidibacter hongkongensis]|uniref:hypothetical protein n=1 Tax=Polycladidibacter hongkongensis TaxID=1647556 RepID=UPI0008335B00|nr:hypothetical protein [Pseudovibrio hongkongensis]
MLNVANAAKFCALALALALAACADNPLPRADISGMIENQSTPPTVPADRATIAFEQFSGIPGNEADALARLIAERANVAKLNLVRRIGAPATYRVQGHLSASGFKNTSTIHYVFDVYDSSGKRVHRIEGQELTKGNPGDPWGSIESGALKRVAARTVAALDAWLHSS